MYIAQWCGCLLGPPVFIVEMSFPDSEEVLAEVLERFASRNVVLLHRAVVRGNADEIRRLVQVQGVPVDSSLLPANPQCIAQIRRGNEIDMDSMGLVVQHEPYPTVLQFTEGVDDVNELFVTGDICSPETDMEVVFQSPLQRAAYTANENADTVRLLLELGANADYVSPDGKTAIIMALEGCCEPEVTAEVISLIATPTNITIPEEMRARPQDDDERMTKWPLLVAACNEACTVDTSVCRALIAAGCPVPPELSDDSAAEWLSPELVALFRGQ